MGYATFKLFAEVLEYRLMGGERALVSKQKRTRESSFEIFQICNRQSN